MPAQVHPVVLHRRALQGPSRLDVRKVSLTRSAQCHVGSTVVPDRRIDLSAYFAQTRFSHRPREAFLRAGFAHITEQALVLLESMRTQTISMTSTPLKPRD